MRSSSLRRSLVPAALGLSLFIAGSARAQQASAYIYIDGGQALACKTNIAAGFHSAIVRFYTPYNFKSVQFSAVTPPGTVFLGDAPPAGAVKTGSSQSGIEVVLPSCPAGTTADVLTIFFDVPSALTNVTWDVLPAAGEPTINLRDCDGFAMTGQPWGALPYCDVWYYFGPYRPNPPDGATNVPLDVALSFVGTANEVGVSDFPMDWPEFANVFHCGAPIPDPNRTPCDLPLNVHLQPNTTYYWRAVNFCYNCDHGDFGASSLWSFTTGDAPLAANKTTWGRIKAMYRE